MAQHLPDAALEIRRTDKGELTLITVEDFFSYFVRNDKPEQDEVYSAIFGSPRLRLERLAELGPRPEVLRPLARLPDPVLIGLTGESDFTASVANIDGTHSARFALVKSPTHSGWVHAGGFSITISKAKIADGTRVHEIDALIDPKDVLDLRLNPDLWRFLEHCTDDAVLFDTDDPRVRLEATLIQGLGPANFFARSLRAVQSVSGWENVSAPLNLVLDNENLHTMALLAEIATRPTCLDRFGFVLETDVPSELDEVPGNCEVPIVANLGDQALIIWLNADVTLLCEDAEARGVRIDNVLSVSVELRTRLDKPSVFPDLVVQESWPVISITGSGPEESASDASGWGIELRGLTER